MSSIHSDSSASALSALPMPLKTVKIRSLAEFSDIYSRWGQYQEAGSGISVPEKSDSFTVPGFCWVDQQAVEFKMDNLNSYQQGDKQVLNWRERLTCPLCELNSRQRSAIHLLDNIIAPKSSAKIWISEQVTPLYRKLMEKFPNATGSEYLSDQHASGSINEQGIRHEDATQLSFGDRQLDAILSFDVMEHVPDFRKAFAECARTLKHGGTLLFTAPFLFDENATQIRARLGTDGVVNHIYPAQYHGDPVQPEKGVLCYQIFGWDVLKLLCEVGFKDAYAVIFESERFGYPGGPSIAFVATMPARRKWFGIF